MKPSHLSSLIESIFGRSENPSRGTVVLTATEPKAGVSWMASAVAAELAAAGRKVLLADASVVAALADPEMAVSLCDRVGSGRIFVLGAEQVARAKAKLSHAPGNGASVLRALEEEFPHIILDAPAFSQSDVALRLAPLVSGSILVVREGKTEQRGLVKACQMLTSLGGCVLGCIYNAH
jgi:Mrp family chromosome partitioning ATPase